MSYLDSAAKIIREFEGLKLEAYKCPAGVWTIGYGHTKGVKPDMIVSIEEAEELLWADMLEADEVIEEYVDGFLSEDQRAALISFIFNLGAGNFRSSTLLKLILAGDFDAAAKQFPRWNKAGGVVLAGLDRRRAAERRLFEGLT